MPLSDYLSFRAEWNRGFIVGVTIGRENGHQVCIEFAGDLECPGLGINSCVSMRTVSIDLLFFRLMLDYIRPYRPVTVENAEPETPEAKAQREEGKRYCLLMEDIQFACAEKTEAELERILAMIEGKEGDADA